LKLNLREIAEQAAFDPAKPLWDAAGDLKDYTVNSELLLVATYIAPPHVVEGPTGEKVIIHRTDQGMQEDRFQGKVGLVLKTGGYSDSFPYIVRPEPGDWVVFRASEAMECFIRDRRTRNEGLSVRVLDARFVLMSVSDPSLIY